MKAEVTFNQVWYNVGLSIFFLREQAERTINLMLEIVEESTLEALEAVEKYANMRDMDIDEIEEFFYSYSAEDCALEIGLTIAEEDEEDEDDND